MYVVRLKEKIKLPDGSVGDVACLKRVVAPDKEALAIVRTEVETMVRPWYQGNSSTETIKGPSKCCNLY